MLVTKFMYTYAVGATFAVLPAIRQEKDFEGQSPQCSAWPKGGTALLEVAVPDVLAGQLCSQMPTGPLLAAQL